MSIFALWAEIVSCNRVGRAVELISWSRPLLSGYTGTDTAVIFPFVTVICTWTGPHRVSVESPRTVLLPDDAALLLLGAAALVVVLTLPASAPVPLESPASPDVVEGTVIPAVLGAAVDE